MVSDKPDAFCEFAKDRGLHFSAKDVNAAPRDVTAAPDELERYTLASLTAADGADAIQMVFITDQLDGRPLSMRDVLWWVAADTWAVEQSGRDFARWAVLYRHAADSAAASRMFQLHVKQADALLTLLGESNYRALLTLYRTELGK